MRPSSASSRPRRRSRSPRRSRTPRVHSFVFTGPPAIPTVRHPVIFAICPTADPTDPAAVETTTVSPAAAWPISSRPKYAVMPLSPSTPSESDNGRSALSDLADHRAGVHGRVILPAEHAHHAVAFGELRVARRRRPARREGAHHLADPDRRRIVRDRAHPSAHGRLDRQKLVAHQNLPVARLRDGTFDQFEMLGLGNSAWPGFQEHLAVLHDRSFEGQAFATARRGSK